MPRFCLIVIFLFCSISIQAKTGLANPIQDNEIEITGSESRTWKSADGKFSKEGTLVEIQGDKLRLKDPEGKSFTVPLNKLSAIDRKFVQAEKKRVAPPGDTDSDNSFKAPSDKSDSSSSNKSGNKSQQVNLSSIKPITLKSDKILDRNADRWKKTELDIPVNPIKIPGDFHDDVVNVFSSPDNKYLFLSLENPFRREGEKDERDSYDAAFKRFQKKFEEDRAAATREWAEFNESWRNRSSSKGPRKTNWIEMYELPSGKLKFEFPLENDFNAWDFFPEHNSLLVCPGPGRIPKEAILQLYSLEQDQLVLKKTIAFVVQRGFTRIISARFLVDGKILVELFDGLAVLSADKHQPVFSCPKGGLDWQLASDRRHAIVDNFRNQFEVDLIDGKCIAANRNNSLNRNIGTPSPDGKRTAEIKKNTVTIRNQKGDVEDEFFVPLIFASELTWLDDETILAQLGTQQSHYIDVKNRVDLMEAVKLDISRFKSNGRGWTVEKEYGSSPSITISLDRSATDETEGLPGLEESRKLLGAEADDLLLLRKGDRVSIKVDLNANPSFAGEARKIVEELLASRGVKVDSSANDVLLLESSKSEKQVEYHEFGRSPQSPDAVQIATVRHVTTSISLTQNGKVVWAKRSYNGPPGGTLQLEQGESVQQALNRYNVDPDQFWKSLSLPKNIAIHPDGKPWQRFRKTEEGYKESED